VLMWLSEVGEDTPTVSVPGIFTAVALTIGVAMTLILGLVPSIALETVIDAGAFLR
nr:NADH-quinone oxidoreductase subunit N [Longispora sp. (in: high G+C Gram-positive bacteria)]